MKKIYYWTLTLLLITVPVTQAQVTIGGDVAPKTGAFLDLNATAKGALLLSNVDLTNLGQIPAGFVGITSAQDTNSELAGAIVYNTNTTTGVGIYYWDGDNWIKSSLSRTINSDPALLPKGSGRLSGRTIFDVARVRANSGECGDLSVRQSLSGIYADFTQMETRTRTYTFRPSGTVSNVRFAYIASQTGIVSSLTANADYSAATSSDCTATLVYSNYLNDRASRRSRTEALTVDIYAIYTKNERDYAVKLTAKFQDCAFCGAYTVDGVWTEQVPSVGSLTGRFQDKPLASGTDL
jgi:hypothetical protein